MKRRKIACHCGVRSFELNKALFLDRDGVINEDNNYVHKIEDFVFIDGIFDVLEMFQQMGYLLIIVSNQAGIARGYYSEKDFLKLNKWMCNEFAKKGIHITKTYYCPYHPVHGKGSYLADSLDRKPNPGMILKAKDEFDISLKDSILVGDKISDMEVGRRSGIGTLIFLKGKYEADDAKDVRIITNINEMKSATKWVIR